LDLLYCLTPAPAPPLSFPSLLALAMVIDLEASTSDNTNRHGSKKKPHRCFCLAIYIDICHFCVYRSNPTLTFSQLNERT
jgi:hypothetical protein